MNKIKLNPGDCLKITYEIDFQNTKLKKVTLDLEKLQETIVRSTKEYKDLYCWTHKKGTD